MDRPIGIYLLALLTLLLGGWRIFVGLMALFFGGIGFLGGYWDAMAVYWFYGIVDLVIGIIALALALGLFRFRPWAVMWTILIVGLGILFDVVAALTSGSLNWVSLLISIVVLVYLLLPGTRQAFQE